MTLGETIVEVLHALRDARNERDVYREIALTAIHRLHDQYVQIATQQVHVRRLCGQLRDLRATRASSNQRRLKQVDLLGVRPVPPTVRRSTSTSPSAPREVSEDQIEHDSRNG